MKRFLKYMALTAMIRINWMAAIFIGMDKGWWHTPFTLCKFRLATHF